MNKKQTGIINNPKGVDVSCCERLEYGVTVDIISTSSVYHQIQPHGMNESFNILAVNVLVTN